MDTITKGRLGYNLVEKALLRRDYEIYVPVLENTKIDCIAIKNGIITKIQIKTFQIDKNNKKTLPVRKISHNQGAYKIHHYTSDEINFFFGVDLDEEDIYVIPIDFIEKYSSAISIKTLLPYKNNFNLMELNIGNDINGGNDFGERC